MRNRTRCVGNKPACYKLHSFRVYYNALVDGLQMKRHLSNLQSDFVILSSRLLGLYTRRTDDKPLERPADTYTEHNDAWSR